MSGINAWLRDPGEGDVIEGTTPSPPLRPMTTLTYRGVTYTPAAGIAPPPRPEALIYRGCTVRAPIEPPAALSVERVWLGQRYAVELLAA